MKENALTIEERIKPVSGYDVEKMLTVFGNILTASRAFRRGEEVVRSHGLLIGIPVARCYERRVGKSSHTERQLKALRAHQSKMLSASNLAERVLAEVNRK